MKTYINNFLKYKYLLKELVIRDIKVKYRRSFLGIVWSLVNPLMMMIVLNIVFSNLFKIQIENFLIYLLTGQTLFVFLSEATNVAMQSIIGSSSLIKKVYVPKYIFPVSKVLSSFVNLLFSLVAVFIMMIVTKAKFTVAMMLIPLLLVYILFFVLGLGIILAAYTVFFRDLIYLYGILTTAWMYFTPIMYPVSIIPSKYMIIMNLNPMYFYIEYFRQLVLYGKIPSFSLNAVCLSISLCTFIIGLLLFHRNQNKFILYI